MKTSNMKIPRAVIVHKSYLAYISGNETFPVAQMVKRLPTIWEARVQSLSWEDLLEQEMATHSSVLAWKIPWTEEPGGL